MSSTSTWTIFQFTSLFRTHCTSLVKTPVPFLSFCTKNTYKNDFLDRHNGGLWKPHINQDWYQSEILRRNIKILDNFFNFWSFCECKVSLFSDWNVGYKRCKVLNNSVVICFSTQETLKRIVEEVSKNLYTWRIPSGEFFNRVL